MDSGAPLVRKAASGEEGSADARQGRFVASLPRCRVGDWARIAGDKLNPLWAVATGRLKISGGRGSPLRLPAIVGGA